MDAIIAVIKENVKGDQIAALVLAALILLATAVISHVITRLIRRILRVDGIPLSESSILVNIGRACVWVVGVSIMLSGCFGVDVNALLAALGIGGVALSLGMQDTVKNFIGGLQVTLLGIVHPGDHIVVGQADGIVQDVSWRQTIVKDYDNNTHLIPNALINSTTVMKLEPSTIVVTRISFINDGRDLDEMIPEMEQLAKRAIEQVAELEKDPWILMTELGEYGMWGKLRFVLKDTAHAREARDAALRAIAPYTRGNSSEMLPEIGEEG